MYSQIIKVNGDILESDVHKHRYQVNSRETILRKPFMLRDICI